MIEWVCRTCGHRIVLPEGTEPREREFLHSTALLDPFHSGPWERVQETDE